MRMTIGMARTFNFLPPSGGTWMGVINIGDDSRRNFTGWQDSRTDTCPGQDGEERVLKMGLAARRRQNSQAGGPRHVAQSRKLSGLRVWAASRRSNHGETLFSIHALSFRQSPDGAPNGLEVGDGHFFVFARGDNATRPGLISFEDRLIDRLRIVWGPRHAEADPRINIGLAFRARDTAFRFAELIDRHIL